LRRNVTREQATRRELVSRHLNLVRSIASRIQRVVCYRVEIDELVSLGTLGLIQAASRYDPNAGTAFSTFAYYRIQGAIFDALGDVLPLPRPRSGEDDPAALLQDESTTLAPDMELDRAQQFELVRHALALLPPPRRYLIESHYYQGHTLQDGGRRIGVSKSWASRMHGQTLAQLRSLMPVG
jgi:RNA polymerase sigma factor for flagellar operon FliA